MPFTNWKSVTSSQIKAYRYNAETNELDIEFHVGDVPYRYSNVPESTFEAFDTATSVGSYHARNIKKNDAYPFRKLEEGEF